MPAYIDLGFTPRSDALTKSQTVGDRDRRYEPKLVYPLAPSGDAELEQISAEGS